MRIPKILNVADTIKNNRHSNNILILSLEYPKYKQRLLLFYYKFKTYLYLEYYKNILKISQTYNNYKNKIKLFHFYNKFIHSLSLFYSKYIIVLNKVLKLIKRPILNTLETFLKVINKNIIDINDKFIEFIKTFLFFINSIEFIINSKYYLILLYMGARSKFKILPFLGLFCPLLLSYKGKKVNTNEF